MKRYMIFVKSPKSINILSSENRSKTSIRCNTPHAVVREVKVVISPLGLVVK